ncbi:MAG: restriction endonuclease subunit S [Gammaproteobacteria bacterium]|nr:MAG: restriction endonuclease subunit S [Gammaproteobacteria bacterium]
MLDTATKRRIDTARDILVGKVPDPKSQVEQITIALIYKFMDDMDAESEELGGKRRFFAEDFAGYGWAKLMRSGLGGHETLNLYAEAITRMPENPGIPPLFRDIFKNAYLPYRDPETLRAFLKIIDEFEYDHSERLGDAFEYLLSVLGSQGDAGQFRTPRHIIDFIVAVIDPKKHETVLDPACGTAGFLISSYKHILKANSSLPSTTGRGAGGEGIMPGDLLTPDERGRLAQNFKGYDISPDMVRLSLVNLYLHGFADPHIHEYDCLTSQDHWNEYADVILANPPFMSPKGGIKPHNRFSVQSKRSEVLFVDYMAEHLTPNGRAGIIVPEGVIFQSQTAYKQLRKMLVEEYLVAVVSLPAGMFNPYSGVKTSILILDKSLAKRTNSIAFIKIENDGFGLGAQRRAIDKNDLPAAAAFLKHWLPDPKSEIQNQQSQIRNVLIVEKSRIAGNGDYNLSGERYQKSVVSNSEFPHTLIRDVSNVITKGTTPTTAGFNFEDSGVNFIKIESVAGDGTIIASKVAHISNEAHAALARSQLAAGDVLFSIAGAMGRSAVVDSSLLPANTNQALAVIRLKQELISPIYLSQLLRSPRVRAHIESVKAGVAQYNISLQQVGDVEIPLPPLDVQKELVTEIEGYQKVIDGARAVIARFERKIEATLARVWGENGALSKETDI